MASISTRKTPRRLVLGRETVRTLTRPRSQGDATIVVGHSSCGQECGCTGQMQTY
jgi:hypothetical protein